MPDYPVTDSKRQALAEKMEALGMREQDFEERFIRSSGPGGQHVNKTSTCVVLRHLPSGLEVRAQQERSQALNRFQARRLLVEKYETLLKGRASAAEQAREKIRRQKRRRSKRAKEKMLDAKHRISEKKQQRTYRGGE